MEPSSQGGDTPLQAEGETERRREKNKQEKPLSSLWGGDSCNVPMLQGMCMAGNTRVSRLKRWGACALVHNDVARVRGRKFRIPCTEWSPPLRGILLNPRTEHGRTRSGRAHADTHTYVHTYMRTCVHTDKRWYSTPRAAPCIHGITQAQQTRR